MFSTIHNIHILKNGSNSQKSFQIFFFKNVYITNRTFTSESLKTLKEVKMYNEVIIENRDYEELKEKIENLISKIRADTFDLLNVIKFLVKYNQFKYAYNILMATFQDVLIGENYEEILNLLKRISDES